MLIENDEECGYRGELEPCVHSKAHSISRPEPLRQADLQRGLATYLHSRESRSGRVKVGRPARRGAS